MSVESHRAADTRYRRRKAADPDYLTKQRERAKQYYDVHRADCIEARKAARLKRLYGISIGHYEILYQLQDGKCAACKTPESTVMRKSGKQKSLHIDHDHTTGQVRGLLCRNCNLALGHAKDDPAILASLVEYRRKWAN